MPRRKPQSDKASSFIARMCTPHHVPSLPRSPCSQPLTTLSPPPVLLRARVPDVGCSVPVGEGPLGLQEACEQADDVAQVGCGGSSEGLACGGRLACGPIEQAEQKGPCVERSRAARVGRQLGARHQEAANYRTRLSPSACLPISLESFRLRDKKMALVPLHNLAITTTRRQTSHWTMPVGVSMRWPRHSGYTVTMPTVSGRCARVRVTQTSGNTADGAVGWGNAHPSQLDERE